MSIGIKNVDLKKIESVLELTLKQSARTINQDSAYLLNNLMGQYRDSQSYDGCKDGTQQENKTVKFQCVTYLPKCQLGGSRHGQN